MYHNKHDFSNDVNGDGHLDIVAGTGVPSVYWFENSGETFPAFTKHEIDPIGAVYIRAVDIDADGDIDVLAVLDGIDGDMDGDGNLDIACTTGVDSVAWYKNDGSGNFGAKITIDYIPAHSVRPIDMDGDGHLDILAAIHDAPDWDIIAWYENDGDPDDPAFAKHIITGNARNVSSVHAADIDGDGDPDLIAADKHNVTWYDNFTPAADVTLFYSAPVGVGSSGPAGSPLVKGGRIYGQTQNSAAPFQGSIFSWDLAGETLEILHEFDGEPFEPSYGWGSLLRSGNTLYGFTTLGGENDSGTIFSFGPLWAAVDDSHFPCFVATAAYGSPLAEDVDVLRVFRNRALMPMPRGRALVDLYYRHSPPLADIIAENEDLKRATRNLLAPVVRALDMTLEK